MPPASFHKIPSGQEVRVSIASHINLLFSANDSYSNVILLKPPKGRRSLEFLFFTNVLPINPFIFSFFFARHEPARRKLLGPNGKSKERETVCGSPSRGDKRNDISSLLTFSTCSLHSLKSSYSPPTTLLSTVHCCALKLHY